MLTCSQILECVRALPFRVERSNYRQVAEQLHSHIPQPQIAPLLLEQILVPLHQTPEWVEYRRGQEIRTDEDWGDMVVFCVTTWQYRQLVWEAARAADAIR